MSTPKKNPKAAVQPNAKIAAAVLKALRAAGKLGVLDLKAKVPRITSEELKLMRKAGLIRVIGNAWVPTDPGPGPEPLK